MIDKHHNGHVHKPIFRSCFGAGCWDFGIPCEPSSKFSVEQYVALLTKGLEAVSSLNNLKIVPELNDDDDVTLDSTDATPYDNRDAIFSHNIVWSIKFDLYIPFRIQNNLAGTHAQIDTGTEHFRVHVRHAYHSPVAFVELVEADAPAAPATAMVVVRQYLENQCRESSSHLAFTFLGPTPFHADFHIEARTEENEGGCTFELRELDSPGYSDITFLYCAPSFDTVQAALEELFDELNEELGLFYAIIRGNSERHHSWDRIEQLMSRLVRHPRKAHWLQLLRRARARSRDLEDLRIALTQFEADQISEEYYINKSCREFYEKKTSVFLQTYVDSALRGRPVFPTKPAVELLVFIENRRSKALELLVVLTAAIAGGVAGSLITMLTTR